MGSRPYRTTVVSSMPVIWKAPSPTRTRGRDVGPGELDADRAGHREAEREVVGGRHEVGLLDDEVDAGEERIADVRDDHGLAR